MKIFITFIIMALSSYLTYEQNFSKIPDSLKNYNYSDLEKKLLSKNNNSKLYAKAFLLKAKEENNSIKIIDGYFYIGKESKNTQYNLKCSDSAINLAKDKRPEDLSYLYWLRGNIFYDKRRLKEALDCYLTASSYPIHSKELYCRINFLIGSIKNMQGNYEESINIYKDCIKIAKERNFDDYLRYVLALSEAYNKANYIFLSEKYVNEGLSSLNEHPFGDFLKPYFISNRGKNFFKKEKFDLAINDLKSQLPIIKKSDDFSNYAENCFYIAECYKREVETEKSISYYKKVDSVFTFKNDIYPLTINAYGNLIEYYKKEKKLKSVIYYSDQLIKADKLLYENYKYLNSKILKKYDIKQVISSKQATITSLQNENFASRGTILLLIIGLIVLVFLFYANNKRKKIELIKQKELFENYKLNKEKLLKTKPNNFNADELVKSKSNSDLDKNIVNQILTNLERFETEERFLYKDCNVDFLATEFNTNSKYLSKVINEVKESNFVQYLNTLRIEYIINKLENNKKYSNYKIQALADISGFNNVLTFTRAFTAYTKMTPSSFIKELKNNNLND